MKREPDMNEWRELAERSRSRNKLKTEIIREATNNNWKINIRRDMERTKAERFELDSHTVLKFLKTTSSA